VSSDAIKLGHGSGGQLSRRLIEEKLLPLFDSPILAPLGDSAVLDIGGRQIAFTTDSYVVDPIFFPGGDIGRLAVFGTVNDLVVAGAVPAFISCSLIIEEGLPMDALDRVLVSIRQAAKECGVQVVTGDTKVVPKGKADRLFINTAGVGTLAEWAKPLGGRLVPGDRIIVSGTVGEHEAAVLAKREGLELRNGLESDCAPLAEVARAVFENAKRVSFMRDITRGGLATILNEAVAKQNCGIILNEQDVPVREEVRAICELLGLDALYMACEGRLVAVVDDASSGGVLEALRATATGHRCAVIGRVTDEYPGKLVAQTAHGTRRLLPMLSGQQLPRIC